MLYFYLFWLVGWYFEMGYFHEALAGLNRLA